MASDDAPVDAQLALKVALRASMRAQRRQLRPDQQAQAAEEACRRLIALPVWQAARVIAGYQAVDGELDPTPALRVAALQGKAVALPRITDRKPRLVFHRHDVDQPALQVNRFGIAEPVSDAPEIPLPDVDLFVVPGVALDELGGRLGFGGGYYDEIAAALTTGTPPMRRGVLVGFGHTFQLLTGHRVPTHSTDQRVDWIVTPSHTVACKA